MQLTNILTAERKEWVSSKTKYNCVIISINTPVIIISNENSLSSGYDWLKPSLSNNIQIRWHNTFFNIVNVNGIAI